MNKIKLALLDMNNNHANQGMKNIREISQQFKETSAENVEITVFDVRYKNEMPNVEEFDIFISSGGPGNPHREGYEWEQKFADFLVLSTSKRPLIRDPGQWNEKGQLRLLDKYFPIHCFYPLYSHPSSAYPCFAWWMA